MTLGLILAKLSLPFLFTCLSIWIVFTVLHMLIKILYRHEKHPLSSEKHRQNELYIKLIPYRKMLGSIEGIKKLPQEDLLESNFHIEKDGFTVFYKSEGYIHKHEFKCDKEKRKDICKPKLIDFSIIDTEIDELLSSIEY
ncbi:MAG: hypothetical protein PHE26_01045 [Syntrophomonadaceae bacterium]|nr:hypothetical protein [Syntrophomonadaceae bacterium]